MVRPVVHFEIHGKDAKKLQEFYASLFGWKIDANNPMNYGMVEAGVGGPPDGRARAARPWRSLRTPKAIR